MSKNHTPIEKNGRLFQIQRQKSGFFIRYIHAPQEVICPQQSFPSFKMATYEKAASGELHKLLEVISPAHLHKRLK